MDGERPVVDLSDAQDQVVAHQGGPLLVLGIAGSGRTEALARRVARLASGGERSLFLASSQATVARARTRAETAAQGSFDELAVETYRSAAVRILRDHAEAAGLDPFFEDVSAADRLAMLLDRLDRLPLRRHEIRGNPSGLLARLLERIDGLKAAGVTSAEFARRVADGRKASSVASETLEREHEFAELYQAHDEILAEVGAVDAGEAVLELTRLLRDRSGLRDAVAARFPHLVADELEDACVAERELLAALAEEVTSVVAACDDDQVSRPACVSGRVWFAERFPAAGEVVLDPSWRCGSALLDAAHAIVAPIPDHAELPRRSAAPDTEVRFWRCENERAQAQAVAREIEAMLAGGDAEAGDCCVIVNSATTDSRTVAAAFEERSVPYRLAGPAAFFQRPEVRDVIAWLRLLADPGDAAASVRALSRPPVELRSVDLARVTMIARRRKLDMVSALEAGLESPQIPPEARDRILGFLKLYRAAAKAMGEMRADVFVRRLIERIGLRRHRLFSADPEAAERLRNLSRLGELAASWTRREPQGSNRDFVRHLAAVSEAGVEAEDEPCEPGPEAVALLELHAVKGLEFDRVYLLGLDRDSIPGPPPVADGSLASRLQRDDGADHEAERRRLLYAAMTRARGSLVMAWPEQSGGAEAHPSPLYEDARTVLSAPEEREEEELFGPAEGLHSTYRMIRDQVLEEAWRAGGSLSELRLDTYMDVNAAVARFLEMLKLSALIQRPGDEPAPDALAAINELLGQAVSDEQRKALSSSGLDAYLLDEERDRERHEELLAARHEPSLEAFLPKRGEGLALSATDIDLYRTCPLKYKFARVFSIPQEQTINQRFGIVIHQVLERFHAQTGDAPGGGGSIERLMALFHAAWRRSGFGESDDELQFRERAIEALRRYHARQAESGASPMWTERGFDFRLGPHHLRGRVDRVDELPGGGYELIDYKTGDPKPEAELAGDLQLAIYRLAAREAWRLDAEAGSYWYVLADEKVAVKSAPDERERVERTVLEVGEGILDQDFEPRPSPEVCSWCDFRLICPASEA